MRSESVPVGKSQIRSPEEVTGTRLMSRSKKCRLEWVFFLGENGRRQYNKLCKGCVHTCKQSFTSPHARKRCGDRG